VMALLNSICLEHHVHFSGGSGLGKDNNIMIQPQRHGHIDAHLGFLQLYHRLFVIKFMNIFCSYNISLITVILNAKNRF